MQQEQRNSQLQNLGLSVLTLKSYRTACKKFKRSKENMKQKEYHHKRGRCLQKQLDDRTMKTALMKISVCGKLYAAKAVNSTHRYAI